jgi:hypothetical protein
MRYGQHYKMYTLWHVNHGSRFYNEHYIQNLGVDFEESLAKAKVLAHGHEVMIDAPDNLNSVVRGEDVLRFGKYRDQHVADLTDEKYLLWLSRGASLPSKHDKDIWIESLERTSPVRIAAQNKCVDLGLLVWYNDRLMTVEGRDKLIARQNSQYIGEVGVKLDIEVTIERISSYEGGYGTTWIYNMIDDNGNVIVYKGSSCFYSLAKYTDQLNGKILLEGDKGWDKLFHVGISEGRFHTRLDGYDNRMSEELVAWLTAQTFDSEFQANYVDESHNLYFFDVERRKSFNKGDRVRIAGKVKEHTEYNGINQTYVQRIKMFKI